MTLYTFTLTLILIMDPLGNIPIFLTILKKFSPKKQIQIILRESGIAFLILALFVFFGQYVLHGLHVTTAGLSIAGAIILFIIAIRMIFPEPLQATKEDFEDPLIVPLAVPFTAGPSSMAVILLHVAREPGQANLILLGVLIASVLFTLIMLSAPFLLKILGKRGLTAIERLTGMILTSIAVEMFLSGLNQYLHLSL